jgi:TetR/AcrR family transcriptional regulator, transcriptional repressor for nem operon
MGRVSDAKLRLLDSAIELVWRHSYGAVTVDMICDHAGVKKGSFYHFFKSKNDLVAAAIEHRWERTRPEYDRMFSASVPPLDRLRGFFEFSYKAQKCMKEKCGSVLGCPFSSIGTEVITQEPVLRDAILAIQKSKIRYIESALRDAQAEKLTHAKDPAASARALYFFTEGAMAQARITNDIDMLRTLGEDALKLLGVETAVAV